MNNIYTQHIRNIRDGIICFDIHTHMLLEEELMMRDCVVKLRIESSETSWLCSVIEFRRVYLPFSSAIKIYSERNDT